MTKQVLSRALILVSALLVLNGCKSDTAKDAESGGPVVVLDAGARRAIQQDGRSLLPIGILDAKGDFSKGDVVTLHDTSGEEFARGLTNYAVDDVRQHLIG